ncbi:TIGR02757 family protein [Candidatus Magnetominusculus dajiuhuensis]|uniref:TIGR02757 family protein n=1 Tax=Candidatus Magnetominusculus dajiuhuensis TaxID=3137712 RepID=UPI003B4341A8
MASGNLKTLLDGFYSTFDFGERVNNDPIEFPRRCTYRQDIEAAGLIAACLAYGKVELFKPVIGKILSMMGSSPADFLREFDIKRQAWLFSGISYRFNKNEDIIAFIYILHRAIVTHGSIKNAFMRSFHGSIYEGLGEFSDGMLSTNTSAVYGSNVKPPGLRQLFPSPYKGGACKRFNMFLRWMVRDADIDLGIWTEIPKNSLIIPLDTHIARISRCLGLTNRKGNDWKTAVQITEALRRLDPDDPLKYDFALCHHGISGACGAMRDDNICKSCAIYTG